MNQPVDPLFESLVQAAERSELATSIYAALKSTGRLHAQRILWYRCQHRCTLLDMIETPHGLLLGFPRYKTSPAVTASSSSESGRSKNTEDGGGKWKLHASFMDPLSNPPVSCDHLRLVQVTLAADLAAGHAEVVVRSDGTRYAVC